MSVKRLSSKYRTDISDLNRSMAARFLLALQRLNLVAQFANDPWERCRHWTFTSFTDLLYRRIVFHPNYTFNDHANASYELALGKERESIQREENARKEREEEARKEREMAEAALRAAIVPYTESDEDDDDVEEEEDEDFDNNEGFLGWGVENGDDSIDKSGVIGDNDEAGTQVDEGGTSLGQNSNEEDNVDESEWDQIESADIDEGNELDPFAWARKFMWAEGERFVHSFDSVVIVTIRTTREGTLLLTNHSIYFHQTGESIDVITKEKVEDDGKAGPTKQDKKWRLSRLTDIHGRRYMLKAQALELFFANMEGKSAVLCYSFLSCPCLAHMKMRCRRFPNFQRN